MPGGLTSLHLVDLAIVILVAEALLLAASRKWHSLPGRDIALIALAGLGLLLALRAALAGAQPALVVMGLTLGGLAHAADLVFRLKDAGSQKR